MVEVELAHTPFVILHCKTVIPTAKPLIVEDGLFTAAIVPLPDTILQVPTPTLGVFAAKVALPALTHIVWATPAILVAGTSST